MKKHVELDAQRQPFGPMKEVLCSDIKKYAKDLDPTTGWEGQPRSDRKRLLQRLYADWQMCGESNKVCEKWMQPIITKVLINTRWRLNQLIDNNMGKPADVHSEHWSTLVAMQTTEASQAKSEHMRSISKGKWSTTTQLKAIEREVVSRLTMLKNRPPYDAEVDAEVAKEYQRLQDEKRKVRPDHGREIESIRTRVSDLEGSVNRLGDDMAASHKRLEEMMQSLLHKVGFKEGITGDDMQAPASSGKLVDTLLLTSNTAEAKTVLPEPTLTPLLNAMSVVDVPSSSALYVCSDVIKYVASNATMNKAADHASIITDITTVVEEIVHEDGNKALESDVIADMTEDLVDEAVGQSGVENDDGHRAGEEIGATADENMVEQEDVEVPEQSGSRPRRVRKSAHSTKAAKSTTVKAAMPKTVGLPKPPLNPGNQAGSATKADVQKKK